MFNFGKLKIYFLLLLLFANGMIYYSVFAETGNNLLKVSFLNVGQGDAIFIESPTGNQILIDGGPDKNILNALGRMMPFYDKTIDMVLTTHPDQDHIVNIEEYAFDLDPTKPNVPPVSLMTTPGQIALEYRYDPTRSISVEIQAQTSTDLSHWSAIPSADIRDSTNGFRTVTLRTDGPRGFLRLRLQVQP